MPPHRITSPDETALQVNIPVGSRLSPDFFWHSVASAVFVTGRDIETFDPPLVPFGDPVVPDDIQSAFGTFSGGTAHVVHILEFYASPPNGYDIGDFATLTLFTPVEAVKFFFIHGTGIQGAPLFNPPLPVGTVHTILQGTATAFNGGMLLGSVTSNVATFLNDPNNYETLGGFAKDITRIEFTHGKIDNVQVVPEPSTYLLFTVGILGILGMGWRQRKKAAA